MRIFAQIAMATVLAMGSVLSQEISLEAEVEEFVKKAYESGDGVNSPYNWKREDEVKADTRDWESTLAKLIHPVRDYGIAETALDVVKLRSSGRNPKIAKASASLVEAWAADLQGQERDDDLLLLKRPSFVSTVSSVLKFGDPTVIQAALDYAVSDEEQAEPLFTKFTRRDLSEALLQHGTRQHLDGVRKFAQTLDGEEDKQAREMALEAIERIESQPPGCSPQQNPKPDSNAVQSSEPAEAQSGENDGPTSRIPLVLLVCAALALVIIGIKKLGSGKSSSAD